MLRDFRVLRREFGTFLLRTVMNPLAFVFVFTWLFLKIGQTFQAAGVHCFATVLPRGLMAVVLWLASLTAWALVLAFGTSAKPKQIGLIFSIIVVPVTFLGCVYYPWATLVAVPWLQIVVLLNPLVYVSEGLRASLTPS